MPDTTTPIDAITLEVMRNALQSIAEEMGAVLKNTSFSPNIKERMDASCAVFDADGELVAQAEHVPVHLGSMLKAIRQVLDRVGKIDDGDVILVNDPYIGGAHLPDVSLIGPVFSGGELLGFIANRAHHADVGGMEPGSMPGRSSEIYQEGLVIPPVKLYRRGELMDDILALVLANVRTADERRGDLNAQLSALRTGQKRLLELTERHGRELLRAAMAAIQDYAERRIRRRLAELPDGVYLAEDVLDSDGIDPEPVPVKVRITIRGDQMTLDFNGSAAPRKGNINAVAPMVYSASFYAIKVFTDPEVPVNGGTFRPVEILIPGQSFLNAQRPAAVCAGNTETTHRVCDTVLKAAAQFAPDAVHAASQGTMNLIGIGGVDPRNGRPYTYIETIAGGEGGRPWGDGTDGVQCNMTNTMNTPVEALEITYPLRVERYELRPNSGGAGRHRGGLGVTRAVRVIGHEARVSLSAERRLFQPYGLHGGEAGQTGQNAWIDACGIEHELPGKTTFSMAADGVVVVHTPGGGGWQEARQRPDSAKAEDIQDEKWMD
jgi:N-methylhydantoinase B